MHKFSKEVNAHLLLEVNLMKDTCNRIVGMAANLAGSSGCDIFYGEIKNAVYYMYIHEADDGRYPSLSVSVPNEGYADLYDWRAELTFLYQDTTLSSQVIVRGDDTIEVRDYSKNKVTALGSLQSANLLDYLDYIKEGLIPELG